MVFGLIVIAAVIIVLAYGITSENPHCLATSSVIREVWSGKPHLCCHRNNCSIVPEDVVHREGHSNAQTSNTTSCACRLCPCEAIDSFFVAFAPAVCWLTSATEIASSLYYDLLQMFGDFYDYFTRVNQCRTACLREAQIVNNEDDAETFNFGEKRPSVEATTSKESAKSKNKLQMGSSKKSSPKTSDETLNSDKGPSSSYCAKCNKTGRVCMGRCPNAKK